MTFEDHVEELKKCIMAIEPGALASKYVVDNIIPLLKYNLREKWNNNNCESVNHMLKAAVNSKSQDLPKMTRTIKKIFDAQYIDATRAIYGQGNYRLRHSNAKHQLTFEDWWAMSVYKQERIIDNCFRLIKPTNFCTSADGSYRLPMTSTAGKKPSQRKRQKYGKPSK